VDSKKLMPENTQQSYLNLERPDLIKEWHPTKNGKLNPRNVTCDHAEKVWWLCENGHDWEATVKSRMAGDRCPICVTELVKEQSQKIGAYLQEQQFGSNDVNVSEKTNNLFQEDFDNNYEGIELRKYKRYKYTTTVMLEDLFSEIRVYAQMQNVSRQGMYFETSAFLKPGRKIRVKFDKPFFKSKDKNYKSAATTVKWCKKLDDEEGYAYGYGLGVQLNYS
jgi:hypothetical protein